MSERWDHPLARPLTLRDGRILRTLADARDAVEMGRRTALNDEPVDLAIGLLTEAAESGRAHG